MGGNHDESLGETEAKALRTLGIDLDAVREAVEKRFGAGALEQPVGRQVGMRRPFTPRAKKVLELSLHEAVSLDDSFLGREHLLLGLIREEHGVAGQVLAARVDLPTLRADVLSRLGKAA
ncbi:MAG: Clp protease N-terminal domain-containing protein [Marmoricola sp.]